MYEPGAYREFVSRVNTKSGNQVHETTAAFGALRETEELRTSFRNSEPKILRGENHSEYNKRQISRPFRDLARRLPSYDKIRLVHCPGLHVPALSPRPLFIQSYDFAKIDLWRNAIAQAALNGGSRPESLRSLFLRITDSTVTMEAQS